MRLVEFAANIKKTLKTIYIKPRYILLNVISFLVYYYIFASLISYQNYGILLIELPIYLIYVMIGLSSILFTISIYSIKNTIKNQAKISGSSISVITMLLGSFVGGCGCAAPLLYGLSAIGISLSTTSTLAYFINAYVIWIFYAMIFIDAIVIFYYLNKLSERKCVIKKKKQR